MSDIAIPLPASEIAREEDGAVDDVDVFFFKRFELLPRDKQQQFLTVHPQEAYPDGYNSVVALGSTLRQVPCPEHHGFLLLIRRLQLQSAADSPLRPP